MPNIRCLRILGFAERIKEIVKSIPNLTILLTDGYVITLFDLFLKYQQRKLNSQQNIVTQNFTHPFLSQQIPLLSNAVVNLLMTISGSVHSVVDTLHRSCKSLHNTSLTLLLQSMQQHTLVVKICGCSGVSILGFLGVRT